MNPALLPTYGADPAGLICGYRLHPEAGNEAIESGQAALWLQAREKASSGPEGAVDAGFLWLDFNLSHIGALPWLNKNAGLGESFFDMVTDSLQSTRVERVEQALIAVVNDVKFDLSFDPSDTATLWIHVERQLVVTARRQPLRSIDRIRQELKGGLALRSARTAGTPVARPGRCAGRHRPRRDRPRRPDRGRPVGRPARSEPGPARGPSA